MQIGPYGLISEVGRGGSGIVFRALAPDGSTVALKILETLDPEKRARFDRERRLIGSFTARDGFVPLLDAGIAPRGPYIVMPFLTGGTLRDRIRRSGKLTVQETLALGRTLAGALGKAHERGIVHRDLKPENIIFTADGAPLVADLGLAKHYEASRTQGSLSRSAATFRGTPGYMASEQMEDARTVGPPADVFALGAILYECLAGQAPFHADNFVDVVARVAEGKFEPLGRVRPETPPWLARAVERALARTPGSRFEDATRLARALAGAEKRSRAPLAVAGGLVLFLGGAGLGVAVGLERERPVAVKPAPPPAPPPPRTEPPPPAPEPPKPAPDPDGPTAAELRKRASAAIAAGEFDRGIVDESRAIELEPENASAWASRGWAKQCLGDYVGSVLDSTRAIELDPRCIAAWANRAAARQRLRDPDGAIADLTKAIELAPDKVQLWSDRSAAELMKGDYETAARDIDRATELDANNRTAWCSKAFLALKKRDLRASAAAARRAIEIDASYSQAWCMEACALAGLGERDRALEDFSRAIMLDPSYVEAYFERGLQREEWNDVAGAIDDFTQVLKISPRNDQAWACRGYARMLLGDDEGALADYTRAIELKPEDSLGYKNRALTRSKRGDIAGAIADYRRFVELAPNDPQAGAIRQEIERLSAKGP